MSEELEVVDLVPVEEIAKPEKAYRRHALIGYKDGKPSSDPPFDELRLVEDIGTDEELKYKGKL